MTRFLLLALVGMSSLFATEERPSGPTRPMTLEEREEIQALRMKEAAEEKSAAKAQTRGLKVEYSSHMGAFHHPVHIEPLGDCVYFEDGSIWVVNYSDRFRTYNWLTSDTLKIFPNTSFWSSYYYVIKNLNTNEEIEVNLYARPIYNGAYTYWIVAIDYYNQQLCLNDGSIWDLSAFDYSVYNKWLINDTVILGHNSSFFNYSYPNIIINCETDSYAQGRCIN